VRADKLSFEYAARSWIEMLNVGRRSPTSPFDSFEFKCYDAEGRGQGAMIVPADALSSIVTAALLALTKQQGERLRTELIAVLQRERP
jgi:hypothetical protein